MKPSDLDTVFHPLNESMLRPNKKITVFRVTSLKILGRVGTH